MPPSLLRLFSCLLPAAALAAWPASPITATPAPRGEVLEVHACEVYTGGCIASSQATLGGRSLLRVWLFAGGELDGVDLNGLRLAALELGTDNLAQRGAAAEAAVLYVPAEASPAQARTLARWWRAQHPELDDSAVTVRRATLDFHRQGARVSVAVGPAIRAETRAIDPCEVGACGEQLWYEPRTTGLDRFTVLLNARTAVAEPLLELVWRESGQRSVFWGHFGGSLPGEDPPNPVAPDNGTGVNPAGFARHLLE
jgi:hypothetical protein